jgi:hypothetical protein
LSVVVLVGVCLVIALAYRATRFSTPDSISLIHPCSKIDELAALRTEGAMWIVFPGDLSAADGAF